MERRNSDDAGKRRLRSGGGQKERCMDVEEEDGRMGDVKEERVGKRRMIRHGDS